MPPLRGTVTEEQIALIYQYLKARSTGCSPMEVNELASVPRSWGAIMKTSGYQLGGLLVVLVAMLSRQQTTVPIFGSVWRRHHRRTCEADGDAAAERP